MGGKGAVEEKDGTIDKGCIPIAESMKYYSGVNVGIHSGNDLRGGSDFSRSVLRIVQIQGFNIKRIASVVFKCFCDLYFHYNIEPTKVGSTIFLPLQISP